MMEKLAGAGGSDRGGLHSQSMELKSPLDPSRLLSPVPGFLSLPAPSPLAS